MVLGSCLALGLLIFISIMVKRDLDKQIKDKDLNDENNQKEQIDEENGKDERIKTEEN